MQVIDKPDVDLEGLLEESIPCEECDQPATLRSWGHSPTCLSHTGRVPPLYKCHGCWSRWHRQVVWKIQVMGAVRCKTCKRDFMSVKEFSDYRRF